MGIFRTFGVYFFAVWLGVVAGVANAQEPSLALKYFNYQKNMTDADEEYIEGTFRRDGDSQMHIIQLDRPFKASYEKIIRKNGGRLYQYIPNRAFVARIKPGKLKKIEKLFFVKKVYPGQPFYKLDGRILKRMLATKEQNFKSTYNFMTVTKSLKKYTAKRIQAIGGKTLPVSDGSLYLVAKVTRDQLVKISKWDEVLWIDPSSRPELDIDNAHVQGGATEVRKLSGKAYSGRGIRGHVLEGVHADHPDFAANEYRKKPIGVGASAASGHGTATFGEIFGSGAGKPRARGLVGDAQGFFTNYSEVINKPGVRLQLTKRLVKDHGVMFQTASWGYARSLEYTSYSAEMDDVIFNTDIPITQSQSNSNTQMSRPQAWAKNIISVGGVRHKDNADPKDDFWNGASIGPAADGRIKPDLSAYYDQILTTRNSEGYTESFGGTSGATPIVAGHAGLVTELWGLAKLGNRLRFKPTRRNFFKNKPHFTTTKALLINSARQYEFKGKSHNLTRVHQGWGFPNLLNLYESREKLKVVNEEETLTAGEKKSFLVNVPKGEARFQATLVYSELPGNPQASKTLINNLDLRVVDPNGKTYLGNHGLLEGNFSLEGGTPDDRDTVENVIISKPIPGKWRVEVLALEINKDTHTETPEVDADFALVVRAGN